jgi:hypothetical protein
MQSERLIAQVYYHLPKPSAKDFEEFASLNPKLAEQLKKQDQALKIKRSFQLGGGFVGGLFAGLGLMRMPMPLLSKLSLTALAGILSFSSLLFSSLLFSSLFVHALHILIVFISLNNCSL